MTSHNGSASMSRSAFLKGGLIAGAGIAGMQLLSACAPQSMAETGGGSASEDSWDDEADVVVIGGGTGIEGARAAALAGANTILMEKWDRTGGDWSINEGKLTGPATKLMADKGVTDPADGQPDSQEKWLEWCMLKSAGKANPELLKNVSLEMTAFLDEVYDAGIRLDLDSCDTSGFLRGHIVVDEEGNRVRGNVYTDAARQWAEDAGVRIMTSTKATSLVMSGGTVIGVEALASGKTLRIKAKAVVVATGGTGKNTELVARYSQDACELATNSGPWATGDGIDLILNAGGKLDNWHKALDHGQQCEANTGANIQLCNQYNIFYAEPCAHIVVSNEGKRQGNEAQHYNFFKHYSTPSFGVYDSTLQEDERFTLTTVDSHAGLESQIENGNIVVADTIEELAEKLYLDPAVLSETVSAWNAACSAGSDEEFGRPAESLRPIEKGPFYAYKILHYGRQANIYATVNEVGQISDKDGNGYVGGLYAGGLFPAMYHLVGDGVWGSGIMSGFGVGMSRVAGKAAAEYASKIS